MLGLRKMYFPLSLDLGAKSRNKGPVEFWQDVDYVRMGSLSSTNVEKSNIVLSSEAETMTVRDIPCPLLAGSGKILLKCIHDNYKIQIPKIAQYLDIGDTLDAFLLTYFLEI